jgi:putative hydrolase of the HAD superfamily
MEGFRFEMIAFDADDTLWYSERFYHDAKDALAALLAPYGVGPQAVSDALHETEMANLPLFGYGIKSFTLSMIETAVKATGGQVRADDVRAVIALGRAMVGHEMRLFDHVSETVERLSRTHPLMVITKGDLMDQERKLAGSGLAEFFTRVEIVSDKTRAVYDALLARHGVAPKRFLMVGNSMRSDILPVLEMGGYAVYVPYELTWVHESGAAPDGTDGRYYEIAHLGLLPELVERLENRA